MAILLIYRHRLGDVTFKRETINGQPVPMRTYRNHKGRVLLDGYADEVLRHDADELLSIPCNLYRMPTPGEQEQFFNESRARGMIQE